MAGVASDPFKIEICCERLESVASASLSKASRVELCTALMEGGLSPSVGLIRGAATELASGSTKLFVLIRPRPGDFVYSEAELLCMVADIHAAKDAGACGIVSGALTPEGDVDEGATKRLIDAARPLPFTFHRAFDTCRDWRRAVDAVARLGCERLLTSGCEASALEGAARLREIKERAGGRFLIVAAAGISATNVREVIRLAQPDEVHASARETVESPCVYRPGRPVYMGGERTNTPEDEFRYRVTTPASAAAIVNAVRGPPGESSGSGSGGGASSSGSKGAMRGDVRSTGASAESLAGGIEGKGSEAAKIPHPDGIR